MFKRFCSYYKPHLKLFFLDMLCALVVACCNLVYPVIAKKIMNEVPNIELELLLILGGALLFIFIVKAMLNYVIQYWGHIVGVRIQGDMRAELFAHLEKLPYSYFDENKTGTIMSRIINDLMDISELAHHGPEDIFLSLITLVGACVLMCITVDPLLTLIVFLTVPIIVVYAVLTRKGMMNAFAKMREETGKINASVESSISGVRVSKAYNATEHELAKFQIANEDFKKARGKAYKNMGYFFSGMNFFTDLLYLLALVIGGLFCLYGRIDSASYVAYILYITTIITPIRTLVNIFEQVQSGMTGFQRFIEVMDVKEEVEKDNPVILKEIDDNISFNNVSFTYKQTDDEIETNYVLKDLSLVIEKGKTVALVGPSGGGKTTICNLIPRFYEITSGSITIDGVDIRDMSFQSLRSHIGIVAQDVFLFAGTIMDNIRYGNFNATDEEIIEAAKKANIHEFAMSLEDGYNTYVGERGVKLSGGQKQRISIARAFLKNPDVLILDEATSALDNVTEMQIQSSLEQLSKGRTTIVVAHRLSTVKNANTIVVITNEGIEEMGSHEELIAKNGIYANLYQYQFKQ